MLTAPNVSFHDGNTIPQLGYGLWQVDNDVAAEVTEKALATGYRHIDTAAVYGNEDGVGRALKATDVPRDDIFVTTKLWNTDQGYDSTLRAFDTSMEKLGLDTLDLYLIHWAKPQAGLFLDTWRAFIELQKQGRVRSIGVSNFPEPQLRELIDSSGIVPVIHQIELHPFFQQRRLREVHEEFKIVTEAWSPLGQGKDVLTHPVITGIAKRHDATAAQVILSWHLALKNVAIPKSVTPERIVSNFEALKVTLSDDDIAAIHELDRPDGRIGPDPSDIDF
ncbi:aldo/keto reductase [Devriesea agamarum]|uniref:aldo/keto reductase n=1 Tax=Devriesea agamarum TaxID=472569 RepID=UPI00071DE46B|nr:aldo/keto reductase [Devriesea agamarum]